MIILYLIQTCCGFSQSIYRQTRKIREYLAGLHTIDLKKNILGFKSFFSQTGYGYGRCRRWSSLFIGFHLVGSDFIVVWQHLRPLVTCIRSTFRFKSLHEFGGFHLLPCLFHSRQPIFNV